MDTGKKVSKGRLEIICGSMFSGKTEELMRRLKRAEIAKQNVLTIKHQIDTRRSISCISSHDGRERAAFSVGDKTVLVDKILELANKNIDVVGIDELHFFPDEIVEIALQLVENGKRVIVAGLELDFRGEPFLFVAKLLAFADDVTKLKAICTQCCKDAHYNQRIINGKPAKYDDPIILVGAEECYEARCRDCFVIEKPVKKVVPAQKTTMPQSDEQQVEAME